ncbi:outer mitochondrial membrane protein porin [Moniliophthora roreri]|nr:outer mitochondrial membrane protein porin [Moniliophthora roreri]
MTQLAITRVMYFHLILSQLQFLSPLNKSLPIPLTLGPPPVPGWLNAFAKC